MTRRKPDWSMWTAIGGGTLASAWLLRRSLASPTHEPVPTIAGESFTRQPSTTQLLGVTFGKPLPRVIIGGGWGAPRPKNRKHRGIDILARTGTPIFAATSGRVVHVDTTGKSIAGLYVVVKHPSGVHTAYAHMSAVIARPGMTVERGDTIGLVGSTGLSSAPHLHLNVYLPNKLLPIYRDHFGTPTPGFPRKGRWGTLVPAESLIPADGHWKRVVANARKRGVELLPATSEAHSRPKLDPPFVPRPVARTYDDAFHKYGAEFRIPSAYLRALAKRESNLNPLENAGPAWGLMQIVEVVRKDFNKRYHTRVSRPDLLRAHVNVRIGASALRTIIDSYKRNHADVPNMREDWNNPHFVELVSLGWNSGWSEVAGVGRVVRHLKAHGYRDITIDLVHANARAAGGIKFLSSNLRVWWCKTVALLYFAERKRDARQHVA